ncbi:secreted RxLR effector protein 161-like [Zingiber officinale]|uniref:secreted RxLR effector protein 161-like n=1 Tax=Zingiber officinale TaxID=94328 RepID=UPI001C4B9BD7|nr:secreted RxLR effector protein 161-like [Zingiber officinale]
MTDCNVIKHPMEPKTQLHKDLEGTPVDATEYRRIIGCLRYLLHIRSDLLYSVGMASRYMERHTIMHHKVVKQILRYLKGTIYFELVYIKGPQEIGIFGYSDSDLAGDLDGRKTQKQKTVTFLSCEAEFMAVATAACHALWLRSLASELIGVEPKPVTLFVDNKSTIALMKNPESTVAKDRLINLPKLGLWSRT